MHAAHSQSPAILCAFVQIRKKSFGDKIKVHRTKQKPFDQFVKVFVHLFTNTGSLIFRSPVEPVGFDGMNHTQTDMRRTSSKCFV